MDESSLREAIETCVLAAGDIITGAENDRADHMTKSGHANFVTVYDQKVQEFLIGRLSKLVPEARFLGEEEGKDRFRDDYNQRTGRRNDVDCMAHHLHCHRNLRCILCIRNRW